MPNLPDGFYYPQTTCEDYQYTVGDGVDIIYFEGDQFQVPVFNPKDNDEFIYVKTIALDNNLFQTSLVKRKVSDTLETVLCTGVDPTNQPRWGNQGWILIVRSGRIWKIHESGSGLTQIIDVFSYFPTFTSSGTEFIHYGSNLQHDYRPLFNLSGVVVDSMKRFVDNYFLFPLQDGFTPGNDLFRFSQFSDPTLSEFISSGICQLKNNEIESILWDNTDVTGFSFSVLNSTHIYFVVDIEGLYRLNIQTKQIEKLMQNCWPYRIVSLSMSPNGRFLLFERIRGEQIPAGSATRREQSEIFLYDVLLGLEKKVLGE